MIQPSNILMRLPYFEASISDKDQDSGSFKEKDLDPRDLWYVQTIFFFSKKINPFSLINDLKQSRALIDCQYHVCII